MKAIKVQVGKAIYVPADKSGHNESATVQVFPVQVSTNSYEVREHFVICTDSSFSNQAELESFASRLKLDGVGAICDFIIHDTEGGSTVVTDVNDEAFTYEVAAAVAIVKASCGWDESNPIIVQVNDIEVPVVAHFDEGEWIANFPNAG